MFHECLLLTADSLSTEPNDPYDLTVILKFPRLLCVLNSRFILRIEYLCRYALLEILTLLSVLRVDEVDKDYQQWYVYLHY